jgi:hypothetical protein
MIFTSVLLLGLSIAGAEAAATAECDAQHAISAARALAIAVEVAPISDDWTGLDVRVRNSDDHYWVIFFGKPSPPDSERSVQLDLCGNVVEILGGMGKVLSR